MLVSSLHKIKSFSPKISWRALHAILMLLPAIAFFREKRKEMNVIIPQLQHAKPFGLITGAAATLLYIFFRAGTYKKNLGAIGLGLQSGIAPLLPLKRNLHNIFLFPVTIILFTSCKHSSKEKDPVIAPATQVLSSGYDLLHPKKSWVLPDALKEISGLCRLDSTHFIAIEDLHPFLYLLKTDTAGKIEKTIPFEDTTGEKFDIEDVAVKGDTAYALWSHGEVYQIADWKTKPVIKSFSTSLTKEDNTEGLCFDPSTQNLLIACKNKSGMEDEKKSTRAIYSFDLKTGVLNPTPFMLIHKKDFSAIANEKLEFYPSAIAVHPVTNTIYVLSTRENKCLAVYNRQGALISFDYLDKELMPQPEGLCFSPDGTLYISSQGRHGQGPVIYEFTAAK
jgi:hypothetical protein